MFYAWRVYPDSGAFLSVALRNVVCQIAITRARIFQLFTVRQRLLFWYTLSAFERAFQNYMKRPASISEDSLYRMHGACVCAHTRVCSFVCVCVCAGKRERWKRIRKSGFENATINLPLPEIIHFAEDLLVLDVAAAVLTQRRPAHRALQAAHVPNQVVHLCKDTSRVKSTITKKNKTLKNKFKKIRELGDLLRNHSVKYCTVLSNHR